MSEIKLARQVTESFRDGQQAPVLVDADGIQLLTDLELALAGGGDEINPWP